MTDSVFENLRKKIGQLYKDFPSDTHDHVLAFCIQLEAVYPDARDHKFFHLLSGSTIEDFYGSVDFPGEDSVARFIEDEYAKAYQKPESKAQA